MENEREPKDVTKLTRPPDKRALGAPLGCFGVLILLALISAFIYFANYGGGGAAN